MDFLSEFRQSLPFERTSFFPNARPQAALKTELTELGFYLMDLFTYGRTITASVGWYCPQDRSNVESAPYFSAGELQFRPRPDGTLNSGKWLEPVPGHLISLLRDILQKASPGVPLNLLSEEGKKVVLRAFEWTPLARMGNKEARQARVDFAKKHPELLETPRQLALAMRQARLYSDRRPWAIFSIIWVRSLLPRKADAGPAFSERSGSFDIRRPLPSASRLRAVPLRTALRHSLRSVSSLHSRLPTTGPKFPGGSKRADRTGSVS